MGPHKVAYCELYDHRDGTFTLNVKPQEAGRHVLQIKYGGEHVPGNFLVEIITADLLNLYRVVTITIDEHKLKLHCDFRVCTIVNT